MENNIPDKTLLKIFDLIQKSGVDKENIFSVRKYIDSEFAEKIIQDYIQKGVVGDLDFRDVFIKTIPRGLKVKTLDLWGNKTLKELPKMEAERIMANETNIESIEEGLKCIELDLWGNKTLEHLPKIQANYISVSRTNIETISEGLQCESLNLRENKTLKYLPKIKVNMIMASNTNIQRIADGLECKQLELEGNTALKTLPKRLKVDSLWLVNTYFSENYTRDKIYEEIKSTGGEVNQIWI